ncbi:MAG: Flp pilus assembly protein CpaB [Beijerinckiaceae bacterium]|nr:Flp pilus assembly protein CpaB [Beijerinckiaceae bacterium]
MMKPARLIVLGIALAAGLGAAMLAGSTKPPEIVVQPPPPVPADGVLVAAKELYRGDVVDEASVRWADWPKEQIPEGVIRKSASPEGIEELKGAIARTNFSAGEPMRRERVALGPHSGFIASDLRAGKRAVAINIDTQGSSTAGGFILPNDTVDVVHIFEDRHFAHKVAGSAFVSRTILTDIRVLAIGQNYQMKNGERAAAGANATLEVAPEQAEALLLAQRTGILMLTLRNMSDTKMADEETNHPNGKLRVVRKGVPAQDSLR